MVATVALAVGALVGSGEVVVNSLASTAGIVIPLAPEQSDLVPISARVTVTHPDGSWQGVVAQAVEPVGDGAGTLELVLEAADGGPLCGDECAEHIPPLGLCYFEAELVVIPETTGPVVPVAAISIDAGGSRDSR